MDVLVLENCILLKQEMQESVTAEARAKYLSQFQLD
jgi:hypothetical protein